MTEADVYLNADFARFYDWICASHDADLAFYLRMAAEYGSPVLEVACGTGRVLLALARAGTEVVGVDFSEHMLGHARHKLDGEPEHVAKRVSLLRADMRSFDLGRTFAAVLVPQASIFHLRSREEIRRCFACLRCHTRAGGVAVVDVVAPRRMADQEVGPRVKIRESVNPATGLLTQELNRKLAIDRASQVVRVEHTYVEVDSSETRETVFEQDYRWLTEDEGLDLLRSVGFPNVDSLGDYDGSRFSTRSPRLILVATDGLHNGKA